jgi:hypothetical protein
MFKAAIGAYDYHSQGWYYTEFTLADEFDILPSTAVFPK